ncbi:putative Flavinator of succinate dehydrogenase [Leishmania naiffi]|uniref:Succinate dehydrogenase assembly factor 2, mitochondrial n=1 Tax=Leishmania naiffi TaxID=5678 RepID=A0AAW3BH80_9TRYP
MLRRLALSNGAAASAAVVPLADSLSLRWCSSLTSDQLNAAGAGLFTSRIEKTLREKVFSEDFAVMKTVTPKEAELLKKWRAGDGTPEPPSHQGKSPGTADPSDVEPQVAEGARTVTVPNGQTFHDSRSVNPNESVESKRRRLIYQSRYRGMVEMDLIFGHFARCKLETLDAAMLNEYDILLKQLDSELFCWLVMGVDAPEEVSKLRCFDELRRFINEERAELLVPN